LIHKQTYRILRVTLSFFSQRQVIPSSLLAIVSAIVLEFAVVRNVGSRTATIRDVSEFTLDTAFPIPFFISTEAVTWI
jgi:hypothetical protein